mmetsp:Transcript_10114/g.13158  ORF Transcript_10114/g.13158 Transcript_10114/m.13158 type:complete len:94 (-) Transcript_10114:211-492(-)
MRTPKCSNFSQRNNVVSSYRLQSSKMISCPFTNMRISGVQTSTRAKRFRFLFKMRILDVQISIIENLSQRKSHYYAVIFYEKMINEKLSSNDL